MNNRQAHAVPSQLLTDTFMLEIIQFAASFVMLRHAVNNPSVLLLQADTAVGLPFMHRAPLSSSSSLPNTFTSY